MTPVELSDLKRDLAEGQLTVALSLWQQHRSAALAELIERTQGKIPLKLPRGSEASMVAWTASWRSSSVLDRGPLADQLIQLMAGLTHRFAKATFHFLAQQPADPRLGNALSTLHRRPPQAMSRPLVQRSFAQAMLIHADVRQVSVLEDLADRVPRATQASLHQRVRALRDLPALSAQHVSALTSLKVVASARRKSKTVETRLWDAVYENPFDLECRAVLADALASIGDPRGEFIALQLQGHTDAPSPAVATLLLGPLEEFLKPESVTFANGFPTSGSLKKLSTPQQQVALQCREWATFERIDGLNRLSAQLRSLTSTGPLPDKAVEEWVAKRWPIPLRSISTWLSCAKLVPEFPSPVERVHLSVVMDDEEVDEALVAMAGAPSLRHLSFAEPSLRTNAPWPVWSEAAMGLQSLETLTWCGHDADLTFVRGPNGFDTLRVISKSERRPRVSMEHPAIHIEYHSVDGTITKESTVKNRSRQSTSARPKAAKVANPTAPATGWEPCTQSPDHLVYRFGVNPPEGSPVWQRVRSKPEIVDEEIAIDFGSGEAGQTALDGFLTKNKLREWTGTQPALPLRLQLTTADLPDATTGTLVMMPQPHAPGLLFATRTIGSRAWLWIVYAEGKAVAGVRDWLSHGGLAAVSKRGPSNTSKTGK